jgi:hypothetical protein
MKTIFAMINFVTRTQTIAKLCAMHQGGKKEKEEEKRDEE